ncbi:actin-interacting protein 1-like [Panonychus citri]|uniref:actin-interacting protein 1-like n=1 Tax=Panonychus citri TaxID=50023 RepID=UPI0023081643|nr:actin-interacting protein 1-like [Panonychus citri]
MIKNQSVFASLPRTTRGLPLVLGGDPKGKHFLYPNGNFIIIRDIEHPEIAEIYTEHSAQTTVAKYSPSGFYIASADQSGKVRIWDTTQKEHILKAEYQPFAGIVKDLAWSPDSQRIVAVGEGREKFGHVFMMETGTSVGEISGHSKVINSCDFRPSRPFRIITGGEDNLIGIFEGPPFKFKQQLENHTKYVQSVRYSPNGEIFASGGFDGRIYLFKGKDYSLIGELGSPAHSGGCYAVAWSPDGSKLISSSGDRTVKMWDVEKMTCIQTYNMGDDLLDQQVSCLWQGKNILSVSLSGYINYLDESDASKPLRVIKGHNKSITSLTVNYNSEPPNIYTGSHDGFINYWNSVNGENDRIKGKGHANQIQDMKYRDSTGEIITIGLDDTVRAIDVNDQSFKEDIHIKLPSQPKSLSFLAKNQDKAVIAAYSSITVVNLKQNKIEQNFSVTYEPTSISVHPSENHFAVGGLKDHKVHVYTYTEGCDSITPKIDLDHRDCLADVAYSPDGQFLAAADANRKVVLYRSPNYELAHNVEWGFHTARVNCLAWSPDSLHLASGSLDTGLIVWDVSKPHNHIALKKAHPQSQITRIIWLDGNKIITTGQDSNVKIWTVEFK